MLLEDSQIVDEYSDFIEENDEEFLDKENLVQNLTELAKQYILTFFSDKEMYCGGSIPTKMLLTPRNISLVLNSSVEETLSKIYSFIEPHFKQLSPDSGLVAEDVKLVISVFKQCSKVGIPKEFATGILIMYLEHCEGLDLWD